MRKLEANMAETREALHCYVSGEAHDRWHYFAAENGVSVSALIEELSRELDPDAATAKKLLEVRLEDAIMRARKLDSQRRRRQK